MNYQRMMENAYASIATYGTGSHHIPDKRTDRERLVERLESAERAIEAAQKERAEVKDALAALDASPAMERINDALRKVGLR